MTLAFATWASPTPVRNVSKVRTTHIWRSSGPLMVMTRVFSASQQLECAEIKVTLKKARPELSQPSAFEIPGARTVPSCVLLPLAREENLLRVEVASDILLFTARRELCRRPASYLRGLNKFWPVTGKYLAFRTFYPSGCTVRVKVCQKAVRVHDVESVWECKLNQFCNNNNNHGIWLKQPYAMIVIFF